LLPAILQLWVDYRWLVASGTVQGMEGGVEKADSVVAA
jgi:hypothetical protein